MRSDCFQKEFCFQSHLEYIHFHKLGFACTDCCPDYCRMDMKISWFSKNAFENTKLKA